MCRRVGEWVALHGGVGLAEDSLAVYSGEDIADVLDHGCKTNILPEK